MVTQQAKGNVYNIVVVRIVISLSTQSELCKLIENQLVSFEGHRVDKRSLEDSLIGKLLK